VIFVGGARLYGKVDAGQKHYISTRFLHFFMFPLVPTGSVLVIGKEHSKWVTVEVRLHFKSILAGYLRVWSLLPTAFALLSVFVSYSVNAEGLNKNYPALATPILAAAITLSVTLSAYLLLGRSSRTQKAQLEVYGTYTGYELDPARFRKSDGEVVEKLQRFIADRCIELDRQGFRTNADPWTQSTEMALDPQLRDLHLIGAIYTLSRALRPSRLDAKFALHNANSTKIWQRFTELGGLAAAPKLETQPYGAPALAATQLGAETSVHAHIHL
jgi:hypothetical protein